MAGRFLSKLNIFSRDRKGRSEASPDDLSELFRFKYDCFKELLDSNSQNLNIIADMEEKGLPGRHAARLAQTIRRHTRRDRISHAATALRPE